MKTKISKFINWLRPSFEGNDNKASSRKLTAFAVVFTYVYCRMQFAKMVVVVNKYVIWAFSIDAVFILLLFSIITIQHIVELFKIYKDKNNDTRKS